MQETHAHTISVYQCEHGTLPYFQWLEAIGDIRTRAVIAARINRVALGLFGDRHAVGDAVWELRIDHGPGYRIYYALYDRKKVLLLTGGTKRGQDYDIRCAKAYFKNFKERRKQYTGQRKIEHKQCTGGKRKHAPNEASETRYKSRVLPFRSRL